MITTFPPNTLRNNLPRITPFDGIPCFRATARPSIPARVRNGFLKPATSGIEMLIYGKVEFVPIRISVLFLALMLSPALRADAWDDYFAKREIALNKVRVVLNDPTFSDSKKVEVARAELLLLEEDTTNMKEQNEIRKMVLKLSKTGGLK